MVGSLLLHSEFVQAEFQKLPVTRIEDCRVQLRATDSVPYRCLKYSDQSVKWPFWQNSLEFHFGSLSRRQWQTLVTHYGTWHGQPLPPYRATQNYTLIDFMPPAMQALNRHRFIAQTRSLASGHTAQILGNCWGTVYEILRLRHRPALESPVIFVTEAQPMLNLLRRMSAPAAPSVQPGDVLLIFHRHGDREYLDHTAIAVDQQVVFEKAGIGDTVPYRLIDVGTIRQIWSPQVFTYEWRRLMPSRPLQHPVPQFQLHRSREGAPFPFSMINATEKHKMIYFPYLLLPPLQQQNGRFHLPPEAYSSKPVRGFQAS